MKKILTLIILLVALTAFAEENKYESPMSVYQDNYFVFGDSTDQVKFQVSAKYAILYPSKIGIYAGYTQESWWKLYDKSAPFYETNYQPELFLRIQSRDNILGDMNFGLIDYIQLSPIHHMSNGKDGLDSRSLNDYYGQIQLSAGQHYNIGTNVKVFNYYNKASKNKDIEVYKSYYEADIFFKIISTDILFLDKEELHFKFGGYDKTDYKDKKYTGWYCIEAQFRIVTSYIQPKFFIQYFDGYGDKMIEYDKKEKALRAGIVF